MITATSRKSPHQVPVWLFRQAGRHLPDTWPVSDDLPIIIGSIVVPFGITL